MIRPGIVLGLARAETRLTRRLVRYWLFQILAGLIGVVFFAYYAWIHWAFSSWSATAALLNPRYLVGFVGIYYLVGFLLGLVFLAFDIRARDTRERMVEVLDSLPCSNVELILGKFLGILIPCWIPVVLVSALLAIIGFAISAPIEPLSLISFSVSMAIPAYTFVLGLAFLLTILLRHRLLAAVALVAVIVGLVVINFGFVPIYMLPAVDLTGGFSVPPPSDLAPRLIDGYGLSQRISYLLAGLGMLWLAAAVHPRKDDGSRGLRVATGAGLLLAGGLICTVQIVQAKAVIQQKAEWKAAHEARSGDPVPDLVALTGEVELDPGREIRMELELRFRAPRETPLDVALFSLNPGFEVVSVSDASGGTLSHRFDQGLLEVELPEALPPGEEGSFRIELAGAPDNWFAYLDSAFDPLTVNIQDGNIFLLGFDNLLFRSRYVALMPGVRWLPATGSEVGRGDPRQRPQDFYRVDLTVEAPEGWLIAGPGRRQEVTGAESGRARFRFAPPAPLPEVALVGGPLKSRSIEVEGVLLEVLVAAEHESNLDFLADAVDEIGDWLTDRLNEAAELGLPYPYDGMTLVEIPGSLRGFAGGWRMDTTLTQPTMILMREAGFPTARFGTPFRDPDRYRDHEGGIPRAKREVLERFFENDFSGGNPFLAAARSFFSYQTGGEGVIGLPMDYVYEDLSTRLVTGKQGYFSVHHYGRDMGQTINSTVGAIFQNRSGSISDALIDSVTQRSEVWDAVLEVSLADLDPWEAPKRALDVLTLKGGAMSRSMLDGLGREKTGALLSALRERTGGESFDREDIVEVGREIDVDLEAWLDVWISGTDLPGFTLDSVSTERISDSDNGAPRYQSRLQLRNDEPTPGLVRIDYRTGRRGAGKAKQGPRLGIGAEMEHTDPVRVEGPGAVEIGIVTSEPLRILRVVPYLALNRSGFNVNLPPLDEERIVEAEPFVGARVVEWSEPDDPWIIVDDLDDGFSVTEGDGGSGLRFGGRGQSNEDTDQGLPISQFGQVTSRWSRRTNSGAWGKYRHTIALIRSGKGDRPATFTVEIPHAGEWELEYHLPPFSGRGDGPRRRGVWTMTVVDPSASREVTFDGDSAEGGWNSLGTFEIADGETRVEIGDKSDGGRYVIADAIRWAPVSGGPESGATR
jgi:ABC-type transport system involved in multi-copper enzyme maturation permease subunit